MSAQTFILHSWCHLASMTLYSICYYIVTIASPSICWFSSINISEINAEQCLSKHCNKSCNGKTWHIAETAFFHYYHEWMLWMKCMPRNSVFPLLLWMNVVNEVYAQKQSFSITGAVNERCEWCVIHRLHWVVCLFILSDFHNILTFFFTSFICFAHQALNVYVDFHFLTIWTNNDFLKYSESCYESLTFCKCLLMCYMHY